MPVRCLIVDDNEDFLRAARELLERDGICVVDVVSTGAQAYRACHDLEPDVALVDLELGAETGFEVARQIAGRGSSPQPRVILISTYAQDDFEDMIADSPAISFLPKTGISGAAIRTILARAGGLVS
jgi:CheY-like chemotaxis protein